MSTGELLDIDPLELKFPFELKKQISCSIQLSNKTDDHIAFKVKTTSPKKYCVRPNTGIVLPRSTCDVIVTMQAQREAPADMQCKDKFLVQSVVTSPGTSVKDITPELFTKESGNTVDEVKLRVIYVPPPQPPSPVPEGSEEGSSPRASLSDNTTFQEFGNTSRAFEPQEKSSEAMALISRLTEEKNAAVQQNTKLRQELIHTKKRNRLLSKRLSDLVYVKFNAKLKSQKRGQEKNTLLYNDRNKARAWLLDGVNSDDEEVTPGSASHGGWLI